LVDNNKIIIVHIKQYISVFGLCTAFVMDNDNNWGHIPRIWTVNAPNQRSSFRNKTERSNDYLWIL